MLSSNEIKEVENDIPDQPVTMCPISFKSFLDKDAEKAIILTVCGHPFEREALDESREHKDECPCCRTSLTNTRYINASQFIKSIRYANALELRANENSKRLEKAIAEAKIKAEAEAKVMAEANAKAKSEAEAQVKIKVEALVKAALEAKNDTAIKEANLAAVPNIVNLELKKNGENISSFFNNNTSLENKANSKINTFIADSLIAKAYDEYIKVDCAQWRAADVKERIKSYLSKLDPKAIINSNAFELLLIKPNSFEQLKKIAIDALTPTGNQLKISLDLMTKSQLPLEFQVAYRDFLIKVGENNQGYFPAHHINLVQGGSKTFHFNFPLRFISRGFNYTESQLGVFLQESNVIHDMSVLTKTLEKACNQELEAYAPTNKEHYFGLLKSLIISDFEIFMKFTERGAAEDWIGSRETALAAIENLKQANDPATLNKIYLNSLELFGQQHGHYAVAPTLYFLVKQLYGKDSQVITDRKKHLSLLTKLYQINDLEKNKMPTYSRKMSP